MWPSTVVLLLNLKVHMVQGERQTNRSNQILSCHPKLTNVHCTDVGLLITSQKGPFSLKKHDPNILGVNLISFPEQLKPGWRMKVCSEFNREFDFCIRWSEYNWRRALSVSLGSKLSISSPGWWEIVDMGSKLFLVNNFPIIVYISIRSHRSVDFFMHWAKVKSAIGGCHTKDSTFKTTVAFGCIGASSHGKKDANSYWRTTCEGESKSYCDQSKKHFCLRTSLRCALRIVLNSESTSSSKRKGLVI